MSTIGLLLLCVSIVAAKNVLRYSQDDASEYFETFLRTYNKEYDEAEKEMRFEIFSNNLQKINILNEHSKTAKYGITKFTDLTPEEFLERHTGYKISNVTDECTGSKKINLKSVVAPDELDWRTKGVVSEVKNQRTCGSCWAFSATGNVESAYAIKTNQLVSLSEQELVDCDKSDFGCGGGYPINAFKYFQDNGAMTEDDYPYEGVNDQCKFDSQKVKVRVSGCKVIQGSEDEIADNLAQIGPLSITVDATSLQQYSGGVITDSCQGTQINHAVLLVGYGKGDDGTPYWLVKNSWGANWGESGYFRIQRGVNCLLITDNAPTSATVNA